MGRKRWKYRAKGEKKKLVHLVAEDQKSLQINPKLLQVTIIEETYLKHSFLKKIYLYWSITASQYCVSLCRQQSESAICIHTSPYPLPVEPPSHPPYPTPLGGHKALS